MAVRETCETCGGAVRRRIIDECPTCEHASIERVGPCKDCGGDAQLGTAFECLTCEGTGFEREKTMGHHIDSEGRFQSDKYPDLGPDKFVLNLRDPEARAAITTYVSICKDRELATDLIQRMRVLRFEGP